MSPVLLLLLLAPAIWAALIYNRLIRRRNLLREARSGVEVQLKRRHDLIPNLVRVVKSYSNYEKSLLEEVTRARDICRRERRWPEKIAAEKGLSLGLKDLFAVAEAYPDLKANRQFLKLQENLVEVEDEIQLARRYYNGTVRDLNILIESFPSRIIARLFAFQKERYFQLEGGARRP